MGTTIVDGTGTNSEAKVTDNRLQVESNNRPFISFKAKSQQSAYSMQSITSSGIANGVDILTIRFTGVTGGFVISSVSIASDQTVVIQAHKKTGTSSGSTIIPANLNFGSSRPANLDVKGSGAVSGLTSSYIWAETRVPAGQVVTFSGQEVPIITPATHGVWHIVDIPGSTPTLISITVLGYESDLET